MIRRLQVKFVAVNMTVVTLMLCVIFGLVYNFTRADLENESISMMKSIASNPFRLGSPDEPISEMRLPYFTLELGLNGELISTGGGYYDLSDWGFLQELIEQSLTSRKETGVMEEHHLRYCRVGTPVGTILVFSDMSSENKTLDNLVKTSIVIGLFSLLIFLGISIALSRWAVKPVAAAWQQQKQFVADASHELKTPLTVIMTNAELLQNDDYSEEEHVTFSQSILCMSRQMKSLVENMLELAKSDADQNALPMEKIDLSRLVLDAVISFEGIFMDRGLMLENAVEEGISVRGCERSLRQVVEILLDNAQKYSLPRSKTMVRLFSAGQGKCHLTVSSAGEEISPENREKIFRRFYRADEARSRDGSFGLGLSIAKSIVSRHRGKIWVESAGGINTFIVELRKLD